MAKVIITIEDEDDINVNISLHFDPPLDNAEGVEETNAQLAAALAISAITNYAKDVEVL